MGYSAGIGVITGAKDTPLELAGCLSSELVEGVCPGGVKMRSPTMVCNPPCPPFQVFSSNINICGIGPKTPHLPHPKSQLF